MGCDPDRIRTNDLQLRRLSLYPTELPDLVYKGTKLKNHNRNLKKPCNFG